MTDVIGERDAGLVATGAVRAASPVSWGAVFAGAAAAVALGVVLATLATGFGLEIASPGATTRASLAGFTPEMGALGVAGQVLCGGLAGYLAGRLRGAWPGLHAHESHFRDTAHGLVAWAVATIAGVVLAVAVLAPYAAAMAAPATAHAELTTAEAARAAHVAAQSAFFTGLGMLLSAFTACVAAALGGLRNEEMLIRR